MNKLIFFDIDGTLAGMDGAVLPSTRNTLNALKSGGNKIFLCSGRSKAEIPENIGTIGFDGMVLSAGAYVEYQKLVLQDRPIKPKELYKLLAFLEKGNTDIVLETNNYCYMKQESFQRFEKRLQGDKRLKSAARDEFLSTFRICGSLQGIENVNKVLFFDLDDTWENLEACLGKEFTLLPSSMGWNGKCNGEISEKGMSKAEGIKCILLHLKRGREDVIAVGDGLNDMEMLQLAGYGIAMGNACGELKQVADMVTDAAHEDGIYHAFCRLQMIGQEAV